MSRRIYFRQSQGFVQRLTILFFFVLVVGLCEAVAQRAAQPGHDAEESRVFRAGAAASNISGTSAARPERHLVAAMLRSIRGLLHGAVIDGDCHGLHPLAR